MVKRGKRNDRTIVRAVFRGDAIEQLRGVYHSGRGGATRRVDGPVRIRPAPYVFGCIAPALGDTARARFVVERSPRGAVLPDTRLAHPGRGKFSPQRFARVCRVYAEGKISSCSLGMV